MPKKDANFTSSDRRIQREAIPTVGQARVDLADCVRLWQNEWQAKPNIVESAGFDYADVESIWEEMRHCYCRFTASPTNALSVRRGDFHWPCPSLQITPARPDLFEEHFPRGRAGNSGRWNMAQTASRTAPLIIPSTAPRGASCSTGTGAP
ncbi:MAG UNVERIFIED_CONTAM: hypothetical protein LVT10_19340 [Anaerolineae bacterium]